MEIVISANIERDTLTTFQCIYSNQYGIYSNQYEMKYTIGFHT